jgi:hypothetical protein
MVGTNVSHKNAAFRTLAVAAELARALLAASPADSVIIYIADHQIIPWCLITDRHDDTSACRAISKTLANILFDHLYTMVSIRWVPGTASFHPLKRILDVAIDVVAAANLTNPQAPLTIVALKQMAKDNVLKDWEKIWLANPQHNPTYHALHHPPLGQVPEFIFRIESFAHPIFCTAIRLLTKHAFTGKYNARHRQWAPDPHNCQCGQTPLQTAEHVITQCPLFNEAQDALL